MKVLHIITGLGMGGAEMMLSKLIMATQTDLEHVVISLTNSGMIGEQIKNAGIPVISLDMSSLVSGLKGTTKLASEIRKAQPDVIQTWMYHADLIGGIVARMIGFKNIIWNIRNSDLDPNKTKYHTRLTVNVCGVISRFIPKKIISNSTRSAELHQQKGYKKEKFIIIPNGFDLNKFKIAENRDVRRSLGVNKESFLIGFIARFDPQKDHKGFVAAAKLLAEKYKNVCFALCGAQMDEKNKTLNQWIDAAGLTNSFELLGLRTDVDQITSELDLATMSSAYGEAFPNVIGEAMACGVPCVVTDVGDSAWIVGETGLVVLPNDPQALADAWESILLMDPQQRLKLGLQARKRIEENFSIENIAKQYTNLYQEVMT